MFDSLGTSVNIADQQALTMALPKAVVERVGVVAKRPVANVAWRHRERPLDEYMIPYWQLLNVLNSLFAPSNLVMYLTFFYPDGSQAKV